MKVDIHGVETGSTIRKDIVIIGAGAAGISIAKEFVGTLSTVAMLEAGGLEWKKESQDPYRGEHVTNAFTPDYAKRYLSTSRQRFFGGGTNCWAGWCVPFDPWDFTARDHIPFSGWPIPYEDLQPWFKPAQEVLQVGYQEEEGYDNWLQPYKDRLLLNNERVTTHMLHRAGEVPRFNTLYRDDVFSASNIDVFLNTNLLEFECSPDKKSVHRVRVSTGEGKIFYLEADNFILATGGIENPRLLLASTKDFQEGLGNVHDQVGRYFMEHLLLYDVADLFLMKAEKSLPIYYRYNHKDALYVTYATMCLSGDMQVKHDLLNGSYYLKNDRGSKPEQHDFTHALGRVSSTFEDFDKHGLKNSEATYVGGLDCRAEHSPHPDNRVTLLHGQRDGFGIPRTKLSWQVRDVDHDSMYRTLQILAQEFGRTGKGRLKIKLDPFEWNRTCSGGPHHMGTTRMSKYPKDGVVNGNCKVHGIGNLYIAGSSVFPTGGFANPTLNIVAMGLRLAEHLKQKESIS